MFSQPSEVEAVSDDHITEQLRERTLKLFDQVGQNWKMLHDLEKSENARLRAEIERLRAALERIVNRTQLTSGSAAADACDIARAALAGPAPDACPYRRQGCTKRPPCEACAVIGPL
jgi:hypothetical protein